MGEQIAIERVAHARADRVFETAELPPVVGVHVHEQIIRIGEIAVSRVLVVRDGAADVRHASPDGETRGFAGFQ